MATVTPNFNWPVPTSTDLVKDGATAIEALGDSIDASLVDLKGGTTGQVLSKTSNTDMDFTWVAADDTNAIQNTIVDAKGDLIAASAADTPARLAVGTNGQVLTADSTAATGLAWATASAGSTNVAGKNGVINSGFDVWQRSTSATFAGTVSYPAADRWYAVALGAAPTCTMSRQTADNTFLTYAMRFGRNSGQTAIGDVFVGNTFESINSKRFAGQTVTFSFYAKAGANAPSTLVSQIRTGTGTDQSTATLFSTGWTGGVTHTQSNTVTSTLTRYSFTVTLGSTVNQLMVLFAYVPTGTAGANEWFQIEGVQLEIAASASDYSRNTSTYGLELASCQRYYWRQTATGSFGIVTTSGIADTSTSGYFVVQLPLPMRASPTILDFSTLRVTDLFSINSSASSLTLQDTNPGFVSIQAISSGLTANRPVWMSGLSNVNAYLGLSAEL